MKKESLPGRDRIKNVFAYLAISIFLGGGTVALVAMEPNPTRWPSVLRPISIVIVFLFFQWLYKEKEGVCHKDAEGRVGSYKEDKDKREAKRVKDSEDEEA